jgi:polysaccharide biosynthesis protein PslH
VNVLYLTAEVPYPLASGYLRHFHFMRGLAPRHAITHLSLTRRGELTPEAIAALAPLVERLEVFGAHRAGARGGGLRRSVHVRRAAHELRAAAAEHLEAGTTDVALISGKDTFPALDALDGVPLVVDVCDAASLRLRGELRTAPARRRPLVAVRLAEITHRECRLAARSRYLLFASERDRAAVGAAHGLVVPNGVDVGYWTRDAPAGDGATIAFTGVMAFRANHDAAARLLTAILPRVRARVPEARAVVAGRDPAPALRALAEGRAEVTVTGACPDMREHLRDAAVYCAPLRFASGIQNKLLEALAMELPVVTTAVAAAGLCIEGEQPPLVVVDDDDGLADAVAWLLRDPAERRRLGAAGRRYVARHFSWARAIASVDAALQAAAAGA